MNIMQYGVIGLLLVIIGMGVKIQMDKDQRDELVLNHLKEIANIRTELNLERAKNAVSLASEVQYNETIKYLNEQLAHSQVNLARKKEEMEKYRDSPDAVKYKKLYEQLKSIKENTDDCARYEDTNNAFNDFNLDIL